MVSDNACQCPLRCCSREQTSPGSVVLNRESRGIYIGGMGVGVVTCSQSYLLSLLEKHRADRGYLEGMNKIDDLSNNKQKPAAICQESILRTALLRNEKQRSLKYHEPNGVEKNGGRHVRCYPPTRKSYKTSQTEALLAHRHAMPCRVMQRSALTGSINPQKAPRPRKCAYECVCR